MGTWRNRYRKRFPSSSDGSRPSQSSSIASSMSQKAAIIHVDMVNLIHSLVYPFAFFNRCSFPSFDIYIIPEVYGKFNI